MWLRIVKWIIFLDAYRDIIRYVIPLTEKDRHNIYMGLIMEYQNRRGTAVLVNGTLGVRTVVGRAWVSFLSFERGINEPGFHDVVRFLYNDATRHPQHFQEYIEAAGGTRDEFAVLTTVLVLFLTGLLRLLVECNGDDALTAALLSRGLLPSTIDFIRVYAVASPVDVAEDLLFKCFTFLVQKADDPRSHRWIVEALESEVPITGIVSCAQRSIPRVQDLLRHLLGTVIPRYSVYHSVVSMLERTVDTMFWASPHFRIWRCWRHGSSSSGLKRGLHKDFCVRLRAQRLNDPDHLTARERSFMHAIAGFKYNSNINHIAAQQMMFMHQNLGEPSYILLDYTRGDSLTVHAVRDYAPSAGALESDALWADQVARAGRSGGRMDLLVMAVAEGPRTLPAVAFIAFIFVLVPLPLNWKSRNIPLLSLLCWLALSNLTYGINSAIWSGNVNIVVPVWCDITTKIKIGADVALPVCALALALQIPSFKDTDLTFTKTLDAQPSHLPFHPIHNDPRHPSPHCSLIAAALALVYCSLALVNFSRQRQVFSHIVQNSQSPGLSKSRYFRLMSLTFVLGVWDTLVISLTRASAYRNGLLPWTTWDDVHSYFWLISQYPTALFPVSIRIRVA
ncbi:pheromone A receptor-domain-containing protein [Mycena epipterygia]|nr:pheromone A receptor-domain-containing protein [Mycena epipterygia]